MIGVPVDRRWGNWHIFWRAASISASPVVVAPAAPAFRSFLSLLVGPAVGLEMSHLAAKVAGDVFPALGLLIIFTRMIMIIFIIIFIIPFVVVFPRTLIIVRLLVERVVFRSRTLVTFIMVFILLDVGLGVGVGVGDEYLGLVDAAGVFKRAIDFNDRVVSKLKCLLQGSWRLPTSQRDAGVEVSPKISKPSGV
jgi:hypothetical protein